MIRSRSRDLIALCVLALLLVAAVLLLDRYGRSSRVTGACGPIDAARGERGVVATPAEVYARWQQRGYRGRTVLFIADAWDRLDLEESPPIPVSRPYPLKPLDIVDYYRNQPVSQANLVFISSLTGIARKVLAVVSPEAYRERTAGAPHRQERASVQQPHQGFPRSFTTVDGLGGVDEPVLVYLGASIFRSCQPEELLRKLKAAGVQSDSLLLCLMVGDPRVSNQEREKLLQFARLAGIASPTIQSSQQPVPSASGRPQS